MIIVTLIGLTVVALVTYAIFIMPHRTDWEAVARSLDFYEEPQSFTEMGLEAEWGTPKQPEIPVLCSFDYHREVTRKRKSTVLGVVPASNEHIPGNVQIKRGDLAKLVRDNLCAPYCTIFVQQDNIWQCQCGAVTKHANYSVRK